MTIKFKKDSSLERTVLGTPRLIGGEGVAVPMRTIHRSPEDRYTHRDHRAIYLQAKKRAAELRLKRKTTPRPMVVEFQARLPISEEKLRTQIQEKVQEQLLNSFEVRTNELNWEFSENGIHEIAAELAKRSESSEHPVLELEIFVNRVDETAITSYRPRSHRTHIDCHVIDGSVTTALQIGCWIDGKPAVMD